MTWNEYRNECKANNVEATRADFKGIELTDAQLDAKILRTLKRTQQPQRAMAATA
jgi:hypothetical protein